MITQTQSMQPENSLLSSGCIAFLKTQWLSRLTKPGANGLFGIIIAVFN